MTISDVAERAGVSAPTVSKVINGRSDVAAATRQRVEAAIREHGYRRPARFAQRASLLELIFHELTSPWALEIIRGVHQAARSHGFGVVLSELHGDLKPGHGWMEAALARRPTGVLSVFSQLTDEQRDHLGSLGIPVVVIDPSGEPVHATPSVGATNWSGGFTATRHLLDLGHRRIAMLSGQETVPCARARLDGYRAAMDAARAPVDGRVRWGNFLVEGSMAGARELLALQPRPTAVFAANDLQALAVYEAAHEAGLRIPDDLSVVGFDDISVANWIGPGLTTIRQPLMEMAATATELLLSLARGDRAEPAQQRIELATSLVVRGSSGPPPPT